MTQIVRDGYSLINADRRLSFVYLRVSFLDLRYLRSSLLSLEVGILRNNPYYPIQPIIQTLFGLA
jgi:hypothetical protein